MDASGGIFVFGQYSGTANFNPNPGTPVDLTSQGFSGYFVSKLTSAGNLAFADDLGAPLSNVQTNPGAGGLALDSFGNAYVTGIYQGTAHVGTYTFPAAGGVNNSFVTQVSNAGKILQAKRLANSGNVDGQAIAVNASGTIAVAGIYDTAPTFGSHSLPAAVSGNTDMFVTTLTRRTPGDYFGDGKTDLAIYTTSNAYLSAAEPGVHGLYQQFGVAGQDSVPIAGDYDGDGKTDIAIYNRTTATFSILFSGGGGLVQQFGTVGHDNVPVAGDFNGDGKTDLAIFDRTNGFFSILFSGGGGGIFQQFGIGNHDTIPIAGDFDGDGKTDLANLRPHQQHPERLVFLRHRRRLPAVRHRRPRQRADRGGLRRRRQDRPGDLRPHQRLPEFPVFFRGRHLPAIRLDRPRQRPHGRRLRRRRAHRHLDLRPHDGHLQSSSTPREAGSSSPSATCRRAQATGPARPPTTRP